MAKKCGVISAKADRYKSQFPDRSALMNCKRISTISMYCSQNKNVLDGALVFSLKVLNRVLSSRGLSPKLGNRLRNIILILLQDVNAITDAL